jgi:hypothetical protein
MLGMNNVQCIGLFIAPSGIWPDWSLEVEEEVYEVSLDGDRIMYMLAYELYSFNNINGYELIGVLPERRKNLTRITEDSVMRWGRMLLGDHTENDSIYFKRVTLDNKGRIFWVNLSHHYN